MKIIVHRCNTIKKLESTPKQYGVEVDIRSEGKHLVIQHDPFTTGVLFKDWILSYGHGTLILNVKEEGLEESLIGVMELNNITDYFFLDQSFPLLVKWTKAGEKRCAVRVSEFESIESALSLAGRLDWVWVDCFTRFSLNSDDARKLKEADFKLCLVSPELQGRSPEAEIPLLSETLVQQSINADAICTKRPDLWEKFYP